MREASAKLPGNPTPETIRNRIKRGKLKGTFDGSKWYTTIEAISEYLRSQTEERACVADLLVPYVRETQETIRARFGRGKKIGKS